MPTPLQPEHCRRVEDREPGLELLTVVLALDSELSAAEALSMLDGLDATSAPIVDDNQVLVGIVSTSQLALLREDPEAEVEDAMSRAPLSATEHTSISEVARLLASQQLDRLPIVTAEGRLLGVITAMDVLRWFSDRR